MDKARVYVDLNELVEENIVRCPNSQTLAKNGELVWGKEQL